MGIGHLGGARVPTDAGVQNPARRWRYRPALSAAVGFAVVALPLASAVGVALLIEVLVSEPSRFVDRAAWWIGVLGLSIVVLVVCAKIARRALSLSVLLKMRLLFPGKAPKRIAITRRATSTREYRRHLDESLSVELADEPAVVAERVVELAIFLSAHNRNMRCKAERVRALTDLVSVELRLPDADSDRVRWAALLHVVRKLAVHPDFLNRQSSLSPSERDRIRRHPLDVARFAAPLSEWLGDSAPAIGHNDERHDGTGYRFGLTGDAIPLGGRIVAVVDAYDVMTSPQGYRGPISADAARAELARLAGSQFDAAVVRAFLAIPAKSLRRLPRVWFAPLPFGADGPKLTSLAKGATALIVVGAIVGLTSWKPWVSQDGSVALAAQPSSHGGNAHPPSSGTTTLRAAERHKATTASRTRAKAKPSTKSRSGGRRRGTSSGGKQITLGGFPALLTGFPALLGVIPSTTTTLPGPGTTTPPPPPTTTTKPPTTTTTAPTTTTTAPTTTTTAPTTTTTSTTPTTTPTTTP